MQLVGESGEVTSGIHHGFPKATGESREKTIRSQSVTVVAAASESGVDILELLECHQLRIILVQMMRKIDMGDLRDPPATVAVSTTQARMVSQRWDS